MFEKLFVGLIRFLLMLRYRIKVSGLDEIEPGKKRLFLPNHPALIDPVIMMSLLHAKHHPRPLADESQINRPIIRSIAKAFNPVVIPDLAKAGKSAQQATVDAIRQIIEGLKNGDNVLLYPSGHLYRSKYEKLAGSSAVIQIMDAVPDVEIVLVRTTGLWGSSFSWAQGKAPGIRAAIVRHLLAVLSGLFLLTPKREVRVEFVKPDDFPHKADKREMNAWLESFYNEKAQANTHVPYFWWQGSDPIVMPEPETENASVDLAHISEETHRLIVEYLKEMSGIDTIHLSDHLSSDLGLDSLSQVELASWLSAEFGVELESMDGIDTVAKCVLAASGQVMAGPKQLSKIPAKWYEERSGKILPVPKGRTIAENFLYQAQRDPGAVVLADQLAGVKTWRDVITAIYVLKPEIEKIESEYIGIMLPASVTATIVYLSVMFAGKVPVMVNWTIGEANMQHSLNNVGVSTVLTAGALLEKLTSQGFNEKKIDVSWLRLEELAKTISPLTKIKALLKSYITYKPLEQAQIHKTAVVLFTSGSESKPKAVPLSHENFLANMADYNQYIPFRDDDRILGMLPPFHSFGLAGGIVLPLCMGIRVFYHANPTEGAILSRLIKKYKASFIFGTPTFINGILVGGKEGDLDSLRMLITGAEKCPDYVYEAIAERYPSLITIEGYGITECSPVVSANLPGSPVPGSIGKVLPSLEYILVDAETYKPLPEGERGRLLVRGPSIFSGYINFDGKSPFVEVDGKEWYDTGDLVTEDENNILSFAGRMKRFVKIGGEMISLPAIEEVLSKAFPLTNEEGQINFAVETTLDEASPEVVLFSVIDIDRKQANQALKSGGLSALYNIRKVIDIDEIPVLGTGKTDYQTLKKHLE